MPFPEHLEIAWPFNDGQKFVPGLIFYGYWARSREKLPREGFERLWPPETAEFGQRTWYDQRVWSIEVHVLETSPASFWPKIVALGMNWFVDSGAHVAWCGGEISLPNVEILNPDVRGGLVLAASSRQSGLVLNARGDSLEDLTEDQIAKLWNETMTVEGSGFSTFSM